VKLILFDVDGTLLRCGVQVRDLFTGALTEVFGGHAPVDGFRFAGKTDPQIVLELVRPLGLDDGAILARLPEMREAYRRRLAAGLERDRMELLPGVVPLLERLAERDDVAIGLLTGNWQATAQVKLGRFDLDRFFPFGAFGDDGVDRRQLAPVALDRAAATTGRRFAPADALIIGDSHRDVDCARAAGIPSLAVATGFATPGALARAGADWVYPDLERAAREHPLLAA